MMSIIKSPSAAVLISLSIVVLIFYLPQFLTTITTGVCESGAVQTRNQSVVILGEKKYNDWHHFDLSEDELFAYSAYYDDRPKQPCVRVLALTSFKRWAKLWCQLWFDNDPCPRATLAAVHKGGAGSDSLNGTYYYQSMYTCVLPLHSDVPAHVSFTTKPDDLAKSWMPVAKPSSENPKRWGVCVMPNFGYFPKRQIIEWLEFLKLLGVDEINIYNMSISNTLDQVFTHYVKENVLRLYPMSGIAHDTPRKMSDLTAASSYNDCMYRNYKRYRFIVLIDVDELIVPKTFISYDQLLLNINKHHKLKSGWIYTYSFRNVYYPRVFEQIADKNENSTLYTMQYRRHCQPSGPEYVPKSFVNPRNCFILFNHYCLYVFPGQAHQVIDVDTSLATSHHYREEIPIQRKDYKPEQCTTLSVDNDILVFKQVLQEKVHVILSILSVIT